MLHETKVARLARSW